MKRTTLLISSLALLSFAQQTYGITLDQDEVTVVIEGSADTPQINDNLRSTPIISEPIVPDPIALTKQEAPLLPDKPVHNNNESSALPVPLEVDPAILPPIKHKQSNRQKQSKSEEEEKQVITSDFPTGEVLILNQEEQWLSGSDSAQHSYLGNWMGVTSQSINR